MKYTRLQQIKRILAQEKKVVTADLSRMFGVSIETVRRDLGILEEEGRIRKVYGGAELIVSDPAVIEMDEWNNRCKVCVDEKRIIAHAAMRLIPDNCSIALDSGTTAYFVSCLLGMRENLQVITNSVHCAMGVSGCSDHSVQLIGGSLKKGELITTGVLASDFLNYFGKIDIAVISADGITLENGIMDCSLDMCLIKKHFLTKCDKVIAVTDHTKFNKRANFQSCSFDKLDYLITDAKADPYLLEKIAEQNVNVIIANEMRPAD